jgi:hypothetical protein
MITNSHEKSFPGNVPVIGLKAAGCKLGTQLLIARNFAGDFPGCEVSVKIIRRERQIVENLFLQIFCFIP